MKAPVVHLESRARPERQRMATNVPFKDQVKKIASHYGTSDVHRLLRQTTPSAQS